MKKRFITPLALLIVCLLYGNLPKQVFAACPSGFTNTCSGCSASQCAISDPVLRICSCQQAGSNPNNPFGTVINPISSGSLGPNGGLITLLNNILRLMFTVSGIYAFVRVILAGFGFINAGGDAKKIEQAWTQIWQSLMGVIIIISSIALAAIIGQLLFGDAGAILNPKVYGPQ